MVPINRTRQTATHVFFWIQPEVCQCPLISGAIVCVQSLDLMYPAAIPLSLLDATAYILVGVPVEAGLLEDEPVLPPLLGEVAFGVLLLPQPALTVAVAQVLAGNSSPTGAGQRTCGDRQKVK